MRSSFGLLIAVKMHHAESHGFACLSVHPFPEVMTLPLSHAPEKAFLRPHILQDSINWQYLFHTHTRTSVCTLLLLSGT